MHSAAATHLQEVLHLAHKIRNPPLGLAGLLWLAHLYRLRDDWPTAARLANLVHHHPATEDEWHTKAADLLVAVQAHQPALLLAATNGASPNDELWQVVAAFIGNASALA